MRWHIRDDIDDQLRRAERLLVEVTSLHFRHQAVTQELRSQAMSIQFAGSKSLDDRRRRRLVVSADDPGADGTLHEEGLSSGGVASELVASSAAAPWVPVYEWRIWTYAALIGLVLAGAAFALATPLAFRPELAPMTQHLLQGERPVLSVLIQTTFCFLAAQLAILIGWYRAQCKLDFRGHYRVWPWAALMFAIAAFCSATDAHGLLGKIVERSGILPWRATIVAWLLPAAAAALPLVLLVDRDVRRRSSSLYTLRTAWVLGLISAGFELFSEDLVTFPWVDSARVILPIFVTATVFVGLWLHARVVAYVCPDPPEIVERTAGSQLMAAWRWIAARVVWRRRAAETAEEAEAKPKRGRRKAAAEDEEEAAPKRKRKAPAKRTTKPRTRSKATEVEEEEVDEESSDSSADYETESEQVDADSDDWESEVEETPPPYQPSNRSTRESVSQPQSTAAKKPAASSGWEEPEAPPAESDDDDDADDDAKLRRDTGMTAEQMKGMSKRQKRELRRQSRDQQRNQRR